MEGCDGEPDGAPGELTFRRYAASARAAPSSSGARPPRSSPKAAPTPASSSSATPTAAAPRADCSARRGRPTPRRSERRRPARRPPAHPLGPVLVPAADPRPARPAARPAHRRRQGHRPDGRPDDSAASPTTSSTASRTATSRRPALAFRIGFDFVDLKQCHRYLLNELLAARTRPGKYGGSFENRTRFIREVVARIRAEHPGRIVATRLNVFDGVPYQNGPDGRGVPCPFTPRCTRSGGPTGRPVAARPAEPLALIGWLRDLGVGLINVSIGNPYASPHLLRPFEYPPPDGYETPEHPLDRRRPPFPADRGGPGGLPGPGGRRLGL